MTYDYDKNLIKESLTIDQVEDLLVEFGGEPFRKGEILISKTICHNPCHCGTHKLYYYENSHLFHCYTDCGESWDIFELTRKVMSREHPKSHSIQTREGTFISTEWNLPEAIDFIARKFGFAPNEQSIEDEFNETVEDQKVFDRYDRIKDINIDTQEIILQEYEGQFLKHLPRPIISPWIAEGISQESMDSHEICFDPKNQGIVIPHRDINNRLIGIRERTLIQEQAEKYGKYMPARIGGKMYNHPLSFSVYNLNYSKENIQKFKKAIVFESEKSCLKYRSFFGAENDISCAVCGSNLIKYQFWLIHSSGAEEIIIGFDRQYKNIGDEEYYKWIKKLKEIAKKYSNYCNITFLFDIKNLLDYKDAPVDKGAKIFLQLFKERLDKDGKTR